jgi:hypothetical protein
VADSRSTGRHLLAALGAILLAISVFLPWYGISFTAQGIAYTQQVGNQVASEFGNATLQSYMGAFHANVAGLGGHEFLNVSAHQALSNISVALLILAGLSILIELFALAGPASAYAEANPRRACPARPQRLHARGLPDARSPRPIRRPARLVVARGRMDRADRCARDDRWCTLAAPCPSRRRCSRRPPRRLVGALRLDARGLIAQPRRTPFAEAAPARRPARISLC